MARNFVVAGRTSALLVVLECFEYLAIAHGAPTARSDHGGQLLAERCQIRDLSIDFCQMFGRKGIDLTTVTVPLVRDVQQSSYFLETELEITGPLDKPEARNVAGGIGAIISTGARGRCDQSGPLIVANGFDLYAGRSGQAADGYMAHNKVLESVVATGCI